MATTSNSLTFKQGEQDKPKMTKVEQAKAILQAAASQPGNSVIDEQINKKKEKQMTGIEQAKDRAQVTASTSMSIVSVALLKDVIEVGPNDNKYYYWSLGFIITALILQVLAGFMALYISLLMYYQATYKDDFIEDFGKICCPYKCRKKKNKTCEQTMEHFQKNQPHGIEAKTVNKLGATSTDDEEIDPGCCPYQCTAVRYNEFEYEIIDMYEDHVKDIIRSELNCANYEEEKKWFTEKIEILKKDLSLYESMDPNDPSTAAQLKKLKEQIDETMSKKERIEQQKMLAITEKARSAVLQQYIDQMQEQRVLKRVTWIQNLLNIMLYTVFVLNIFIAGIGLATPKYPAATVSPTTAGNLSKL